MVNEALEDFEIYEDPKTFVDLNTFLAESFIKEEDFYTAFFQVIKFIDSFEYDVGTFLSLVHIIKDYLVNIDEFSPFWFMEDNIISGKNFSTLRAYLCYEMFKHFDDSK